MICQIDMRREMYHPGHNVFGTIDHHWITTNSVYLNHLYGTVSIQVLAHRATPLKWVMHSLRATQVKDWRR